MAIQSSGGSGFVIYSDDSHTYIATCAHCFDDEEVKNKATLYINGVSASDSELTYKVERIRAFFDDEWHDASVVFRATKYDVAVLEVKGGCTYPPLPLTEPGFFSKIFAVGYPAVSDSPKFLSAVNVVDDLKRTITSGLLFMISPPLNKDEEGRACAILMHTAQTYLGNSGGSLLNSLGEVVGVSCCTVPDTTFSGGVDSFTLGRLFKENGIPYTHHISWALVFDGIVIVCLVIIVRKKKRTARCESTVNTISEEKISTDKK